MRLRLRQLMRPWQPRCHAAVAAQVTCGCALSGARGRQVLGTVKNALVVWMGILFLADVVTPLQARPEPLKATC